MWTMLLFSKTTGRALPSVGNKPVLISHHPGHSERGYSNGLGLNASLPFLCPRFPGLTLWLLRVYY